MNAGVTTGCGGGNYCPSQSVTRGQMAQFLNRLGTLDGNTAPSVDADCSPTARLDVLVRPLFAVLQQLTDARPGQTPRLHRRTLARRHLVERILDRAT